MKIREAEKASHTLGVTVVTEMHAVSLTTLDLWMAG